MKLTGITMHPIAYCMLFLCLTFGGCASKGTTDNVSEGPKFTGAMAYGLQGRVKIVKDENEKLTTVFNKIGNIESRICKNGWNDYNFTYLYETPFRYKIENSPYRIDINGNILRYINENDEEYIEFEEEYEFDGQGRVIKHIWHEGMSPSTREYAYQGESRLPYKATLSSYDETGDWSSTTIYKYIDVDNHGNWTKRTAIVTNISNEYEDEQNENGEWEYNSRVKTYESTDTIEEKRTITYY